MGLSKALAALFNAAAKLNRKKRKGRRAHK